MLLYLKRKAKKVGSNDLGLKFTFSDVNNLYCQSASSRNFMSFLVSTERTKTTVPEMGYTSKLDVKAPSSGPKYLTEKVELETTTAETKLSEPTPEYSIDSANPTTSPAYESLSRETNPLAQEEKPTTTSAPKETIPNLKDKETYGSTPIEVAQNYQEEKQNAGSKIEQKTTNAINQVLPDGASPPTTPTISEENSNPIIHPEEKPNDIPKIDEISPSPISYITSENTTPSAPIHSEDYASVPNYLEEKPIVDPKIAGMAPDSTFDLRSESNSSQTLQKHPEEVVSDGPLVTEVTEAPIIGKRK